MFIISFFFLYDDDGIPFSPQTNTKRNFPPPLYNKYIFFQKHSLLLCVYSKTFLFFPLLPHPPPPPFFLSFFLVCLCSHVPSLHTSLPPFSLLLLLLGKSLDPVVVGVVFFLNKPSKKKTNQRPNTHLHTHIIYIEYIHTHTHTHTHTADYYHQSSIPSLSLLLLIVLCFLFVFFFLLLLLLFFVCACFLCVCVFFNHQNQLPKHVQRQYY